MNTLSLDEPLARVARQFDRTSVPVKTHPSLPFPQPYAILQCMNALSFVSLSRYAYGIACDNLSHVVVHRFPELLPPARHQVCYVPKDDYDYGTSPPQLASQSLLLFEPSQRPRVIARTPFMDRSSRSLSTVMPDTCKHRSQFSPAELGSCLGSWAR